MPGIYLRDPAFNNGPTVGARTAMMPAIVVAAPCRRGVKRMKTAAKTGGIRTPPAKALHYAERDQRCKAFVSAQPTLASRYP